MARDVVDLKPIESRDELVAWFAEGAKPKAQWRAGTEHEKLAFMLDTHEPVPYEGRRSIRSLLVGMQHLLPWPRHEPEVDARTNAAHAEEPLQDHDRLHAAGRPLRPRHDVPHLHGADEPRLLIRAGHGEEAARVARAAAGCD